MYLETYKIEGSINNDQNTCFHSELTYPNFQSELLNFKSDLKILVDRKESKTFYKFGDGDYYFLKKQSIGSATPGKRALSRNYNDIKHDEYLQGCNNCDYYTCEIYPENRRMFSEVINRNISYPAEFGYGLVANKWFFETFRGRIGLIGADVKIQIIKMLMKHQIYKEYLKLDYFNDYISIPQKFACDDIDLTEKIVSEQLIESSSDIFLLGVGHVKSALTHRLKKYKNAVYLDIGSGIDAISGIIDIDRPYFGDWTNYQIKGLDLYNQVDYLAYQHKGKRVILD